MGRRWPWLLALVCALVGGCLWIYRSQSTNLPVTVRTPAEIVRDAWTKGGRVALEGMQEIHVAVAGKETPLVKAKVVTSSDGQVRIEYLTEPLKGGTVWESDDRTYRYYPKLKRLAVANRRGSLEEKEQQQLRLLQNYTAALVGQQDVAGRPAVVIDLRPKSKGDRWKRLWIDRENSVVLATEDRVGEKAVLRSTRFTKVRYLDAANVPPDSAFRPSDELVRQYGRALPGDTSSRFEPSELSKLVGFPVRQPTKLPGGYTFQGAYQMPCFSKGPHQAARLEYSDGLNTISLFQCGNPECKASASDINGSAGMAVYLKHDGVSYLAVGDAPRADLDALVRSAAGL